MSLFTLTGYIVVPEKDLEAVLEELPTHIELTRREPGCLMFQVNQDLNNPNVFHVSETFADRNAFDAHQQRMNSTAWGQVTANAERNYTISDSDSDSDSE